MEQEPFVTVPNMEHSILDPMMMSPLMFLQQEHPMFHQQEDSTFHHHEDSMFFNQVHSPLIVPLDGGLDTINSIDSTIGVKTKRARHHTSSKTVIEAEDAGEGSNVKKLDHNAKERIRRMRLNASFLSLRALLPDCRKSKKGKSAPAIVDRVLKYIPEMELEIENLKQVRDNIHLANKNKHESTPSQLQDPTISVTEVRKGEAIIQICTRKDHHGGFSVMLQNVEAEGVNIRSASTLAICDAAVCYQLHIEMNGRSHESEPITVSELRDKVLSWLS